MWWMMLAQGAMTMAQTNMQNRANKKAADKQNKANLLADTETVTNAAQAITALQVQNGQLNVEASRQLAEAQQRALGAMGTANANAAAAQVKGASVDAVSGDIERELGEAQVQVEQNIELGQYNLNQRVQEVIANAANNMRGTVEAKYTNPVLAGLFSAGSSYMNQAMQFGSASGSKGINQGNGVTTFPAGNTAAGMTVGAVS